MAFYGFGWASKGFRESQEYSGASQRFSRDFDETFEGRLEGFSGFRRGLSEALRYFK